MRKLTGCVTAAVFALTGLFTTGAAPVGAASPDSGAFNVLAYNVAGLPEGLSSGNPEKNTPLISPRLGAYDIVNVQEDFNYHAALYAGDNHPYRTPTSGGAGIGDGLNTLSDHPFSDFQRTGDNIRDLVTRNGLTDAWVQLIRGGSAPPAGSDALVCDALDLAQSGQVAPARVVSDVFDWGQLPDALPERHLKPVFVRGITPCGPAS